MKKEAPIDVPTEEERRLAGFRFAFCSMRMLPTYLQTVCRRALHNSITAMVTPDGPEDLPNFFRGTQSNRSCSNYLKIHRQPANVLCDKHRKTFNSEDIYKKALVKRRVFQKVAACGVDHSLDGSIRIAWHGIALPLTSPQPKIQ